MCISLSKKRIEQDELAVYTIFGEMNNIVFILKYSYLCTITILFEKLFLYYSLKM
ncbi:unnamed protein product [Brassica rapa]|uniref:Uncharacterized protein n=1 Tax=Brassica campestris TaxID=3711 RepID=A0A8D9GZS7_BRACM|nr:unnamed protein product [Brassica rapa]